MKRLTYFHSWLLPVAWLFRKLRTLMRSTNSADDFEVLRTVGDTPAGVPPDQTNM